MTDVKLPVRTVVALIALPEEHEVFREVFPYKADLSQDRLVCLEHESGVPGIRLVSVLAEQMGSQSASQSADIALRAFDPDLLVVIGIAGGVSSDLSVGDVCISNEIVDVLHNTKVSEKGGVPEISFAPDFYNVDAELVSTFAFLRVHPAFQTQYQVWRDAAGAEAQKLGLIEEGAASPQIAIGPIACGPVSASKQFNEKLKSLHRKIMAIETESGGVFQRISQVGAPVVAIRGISDLADGDKTALEKRTQGAGRVLAMLNASTLLKLQIQNPKVHDVASRYALRKNNQADLFNGKAPAPSVVAELEADIKQHLKEISPDFKARPEGFYLPIPRVRKTSYGENIVGREIEDPENITACLHDNDRIIVRLPRTFPSHALGWSLAHSLLRQQIDGKVVLPFVVNGNSIRPPKSGLDAAIPESMREGASGSEFVKVFIIEEPSFESRSRLRFLESEIRESGAKIMVLTKSEDNVAVVDLFVRENALSEYEMMPISFSETAFFLERAFDMTPHEAEAVAIRLDDTFRKFKLDAHPTYFAGLQEETIAALINANKRAELIQLAVDGLLTLIVAADRSKPNLSRTTRERFLRRLVLEIARQGEGVVDENKLGEIAGEFLKEYKFDVGRTEFLSPFFQMGILYQSDGRIIFAHPYLESYLLAQALRDQPELAREYFDASRLSFNYYAFDLYCEMGPDGEVIERIHQFADAALADAELKYPDQHIYIDPSQRLATLSSPTQVAGLVKGLVATTEKLHRDDGDDDVRAEKQRILDAKRYVRSEVGNRSPDRSQRQLPAPIKAEFEILDGLSRALALSTTSIGSGAEALGGDTKVRFANQTLGLAAKFSDIWTRNRLRADFSKARQEMLSDDQIWRYLEETGADPSSFESIKSELELFIHGAELNAVLDPLGRVLWRISATAGVKVLAPVLAESTSTDPMRRIIRASWLMDVDPEKGKAAMKSALSEYKGSDLLRLVLANHLLWRVFWHHYKTAGAIHFVNSAKRALSPMGLVPGQKRLEQVRKGPHSAQ
jgi:nucleoside phosphorylase